MKDLIETLVLLSGTPVPNTLVWLGAILIFLAFVRKVSTFIELTQGQQRWSGVFGGVFLICGIFLFVIPRIQSEPLPALPNNTPVSSANIPESTSTSVSPTVTHTPQPTNTPIPPTPVPSTPLSPTDIPILPTNTSVPIPVSNCPFRELADEINIGQNTGACATMPLTKFVETMNGADVYSVIDKLDKAFEADIRTGYQYRKLIPARIPPAPSRQRVMWGSLEWVDKLASGQKEQTDSRIYRIRCNFTNPCIYVILDDGEFYVGYSGRGILLSEPLSDEILQRLSQ